MDGNGWKGLEMGGNGWKWQEMAINGWKVLERAGNGWKLLEKASLRAQWLSRKKTVETVQHLSRNKADAAAYQPDSPAAHQKENNYISSAPQQTKKQILLHLN